jgi:hypothetical protein
MAMPHRQDRTELRWEITEEGRSGMNKRLIGMAGTLALVMASQANAQRGFQFDLNNFGFLSLNQAGGQIPFGGTTHTGSLAMSDALPITQLVAVGISGGPGQAYAVQPGAPWVLTDAALNINLVNGNVTGGNFQVDINGGPGAGGDRYSATIGAGGSVTTFIGGGFKVEGLTTTGQFSDAAWGGVAIADFSGNALTGSFLSFRIQPNAQGAGFCDADAWVTAIPSPGSLACVLAGGLIVARRRRR